MLKCTCRVLRLLDMTHLVIPNNTANTKYISHSYNCDEIRNKSTVNFEELFAQM